MAIQEFDRPLRYAGLQPRWNRELYLSLVLFIASLGFIGYIILSMPGPVNERPLANRQVSEMPVR